MKSAKVIPDCLSISFRNELPGRPKIDFGVFFFHRKIQFQFQLDIHVIRSCNATIYSMFSLFKMFVRGPASGNILLLGMVDTGEKNPNIKGQEYRDSTRITALVGHGYNVLTIDDKHSDVNLPNHVEANFNDPRRLKKKMLDKWGLLKNLSLGHLCLDYFGSPVSIIIYVSPLFLKSLYLQSGWARTRWSITFFLDTLSMVATEKMMCRRGIIWLPNMEHVAASIKKVKHIISKFYWIEYVHKDRIYDLHPLVSATQFVSDLLSQTPQGMTNDNQLLPYIKYSECPFIALQIRDEYAVLMCDDDEEEATSDEEDDAVVDLVLNNDIDDLVSLEEEDQTPQQTVNQYSVKRDADNREVIWIDDMDE